MIKFEDFLENKTKLINEMPKDLYDAAQAEKSEIFKGELLSLYFQLEKRLKNPKDTAYDLSSPVTETKVIEKKDGYPEFYLKAKSKAGIEKEIIIRLPNVPLKELTKFEFICDGKPMSFQTTTAEIGKMITHVASATSYFLAGIYQCVEGKRERKEKIGEINIAALEKMTPEERKQLIDALSNLDK